MRAYIFVDLGFGDAGKGLLTDFLVRHLGAGVVVRYNGGAQAGHNVVTSDGRHHTFAQFGSGTFIPGVKTYLSRHVVIHPTALLVEEDSLQRKGVLDAFSRLRVSDQALVITPFHQAANRIREIARGANRHGSCGVGVGEAVEDALAHPEDRLLAGDLPYPETLRRKLRRTREYKHEQITALCRDHPPNAALAREYEIFEREDVIDAWIASIARIGELGLVVPDSVLERWLRETETVIFEGAQGVLLDADAGFHPFTTWSRCTTTNAFNLITELKLDAQTFRIGVLRSYAVRHGPGPLPTETQAFASVISEHNQSGDWQGPVRYGWFDAVLARYALDVTGGVDAFAVTHLDVLSRLETWSHCVGYKNYSDLADISLDINTLNGVLRSFRASPALSLAQRAHVTQALSKVTPVLETCDANEQKVIQKIESLVGQPVDIISQGPRAENIQIVSSSATF